MPDTNESPQQSLTENIQQQSAGIDQTPQGPGSMMTIIKPTKPPTYLQGEDPPQSYEQLSKSNLGSRQMLVRGTATPNLARTSDELYTKYEAAKYIEAFSGYTANYVLQNWENVVSRMYPNEAHSPGKIRDNFRAILNNAWLINDKNEYLFRQMNGDTSSRTAIEIETRNLHMESLDDMVKRFPQGTMKSELEEALYSIAKNYPQMLTTVGAQAKRALPAAAAGVLAGTIIVASGGTAAPALIGGAAAAGGTGAATAGWAATTAAALSSKLGISLSAASTIAASGALGMKLGGSYGQWEYLNRQAAGANYEAMLIRAKEEGLDVSEQTIAQIAKASGAISAAIGLAEFKLFGKIFKGNRAMSKAFYTTTVDQKYPEMLLNAFTSRMKDLPGVLGKELVLESLQEAVDWTAVELVAKLGGSATAFDMDSDELAEILWTITRDTTANTLVYGIGFGTAGAIADSTGSYMTRRSDGFVPMSKEARRSLSKLPSLEDSGARIDASGRIDLSTVESSYIDTNGQQLNEAVENHPSLNQYISPAQRRFLNEYQRRNPDEVRLERAISAVTGMNLSELNALADYEFDALPDEAQRRVRFAERMARINPNLYFDGEVSGFDLPDGSGGISFSILPNGTIQAEIFANIGETENYGTLNFNITDTGGLEMGRESDLSNFPDKGLIPTILEPFLPEAGVFDQQIELPSNLENDLRKTREVAQRLLSTPKEVTRSQITEAQDALVRLKEELESSGIRETPKQKETKEIPTIVTKAEEVWEDVEITDSGVELPTQEQIDALLDQPAVPEEQLDDQGLGALVAPAVPATIAEYHQQVLDRLDVTIRDMETQNAEARAQGLDPPHNMRRHYDTRRRLEKRQQIAEDLDKQIEKTSDMKNAQLDDEAFLEGMSEQVLGFMDESRERADSEGMSVPEAESLYLDDYQNILNSYAERLKLRRAQNRAILFEGGIDLHDTQDINTAYIDLYDYIRKVRQGVDAPSLRERVERENLPQIDLMLSRRRELNEIQADFNKVFEAHKEEKIFTDMKGKSRQAKIVDTYKGELAANTIDWLGDRDMSTLILVDLMHDRMNTESALIDLQNGIVPVVDPLVSAYERGKGIYSEMDVAAQEPARQTRSQKARLDADNEANFVIIPNQDPPAMEPGSEIEIDKSRLGEEESDTAPDIVMEGAYETEGERIAYEPKLEERTRTQRTKRTKYTQTIENVSKEYSLGNPLEEGQRAVLGAILDDLDGVVGSASVNTKKMIDAIRAITKNIRTPQFKDVIQQISDSYQVMYHGVTSKVDPPETSRDGATAQQIQESIEGKYSSLEKLDMGTIAEVYKRVLAAGKSDMKLSSYRIGDTELPYLAIISQIVAEVDGENNYEFSDDARSEKKDRKFTALQSAYNSMTNYDHLIEKINGIHSLVHKVLYSDIKVGSDIQRDFVQEMNKRYSQEFQNLPGVEDHKAYWRQKHGKWGGFELDHGTLLALLQHRRREGNWRAIIEGGISYQDTTRTRRLTRAQTKEVLDFIGRYKASAADIHVIDTFQRGMDELYEITNSTYKRLYGDDLPKEQYYIARRPDPSYEKSNETILNQKAARNVSLVYNPSAIFDAYETSKPILIRDIGMEFYSTMNSLSHFAFMEEAMTRADVVINNSQVKTAISSKFSPQYYEYITKGLTRWKGEYVGKSNVDQALDWARRQYSGAVLGLNPWVAAKQMLSFPLFGIFVDFKYILNGIFDNMLNTSDMDKQLRLWSSVYNTRTESAGMLDMMDIMNANGGKHLTQGSSALEKIKWSMIRKVDQATVRTGMTAAMKQVLAEIDNGHFSDRVAHALDVDDSLIGQMDVSEKWRLAARYAEYVLERTQPMHSPENTSEFQRGHSLTRSLSAFGGYTNQVNNLVARTYEAWRRGEPGAGKAFAMTMATVFMTIPAITGVIDASRGMLRQRIMRDEEDRDQFFELYLESYFNSVTGIWFVIRDIAGALRSMARYGSTQGVSLDIPITEMATQLLGTFRNYIIAMNPAKDDDVRERALKEALADTVKSGSYMLSIPYSPLRIIEYALLRSEAD